MTSGLYAKCLLFAVAFVGCMLPYSVVAGGLHIALGIQKEQKEQPQLLQQQQQDDEELCCGEGFKLLMDVLLCESPCCAGLKEHVTDDAPHLGLLISCQAERKSSRTTRRRDLFPFSFRRRRDLSRDVTYAHGADDITASRRAAGGSSRVL
jgi:hypothetical protein